MPGEAQQFELQLGGSRRHPLTLEAGQFLHVELREKGPRVVLTLLDPNGAEVARRQTLIETITLVRLFAIAATSGNYTLEVLSSGQGLSGSYEARLEQPRPATDRDRMLMAADNALGDAARLSDENNGESRRAALARLDAAEAGFRAAGDRLGEAFALHDRGVVQYSDGDRATLESMERALGLFRALGDRAGEAAALGGVGRARVRKGDIDSALAALQDATALAETLGDNRTLAHYVNGVGIVLDLTGQFEGSLDRFRRALDLGARQGDPRSEARALANIGTAYSNLGDSPRALDHYERALLLWRSVGNRAAEVTTLNNVGAIYTELGDHARARAIFEQALTLAHEANLTDDEIRLLYNAAWIRHCQREYRQALDLAERSLALSRQIGDRFGEADALALIGNSLHGLGETEAALSNLNEALRIRQAILDRHFESDTRHSIAMLERDRGHLAEARRQAEEALSLIEALRSEATSPELRASYVATQQDKYGFYIDLLMRLHEREPAAGHDAAALRVSERARARVLLEALVQARADIRQGVEAVLLEEERKLQKQLRAATEAVSPAEEEGHGEGGARARRQLETASEALRLLQSRIRRESPRYAALTQPVPASLEEIRRDVLDDDTVLLEFSLGDERSFLWAVTRFDLVSQALPARAQVETAARRVHALLTERQRTRTPAAVREADRQLETESMALSRLLLGGIAPRLATDWKGKRLLIVGSGALAYLPFGALPSPAAPATQPLLRDHEVVFAPSASVLVALRLERTGEATTTTTLAVLADPVFDAADPRVRTTAAAKGARPPAVATGLTRAMDSLGGRHFSRLPFSRQEADAIATFVPRRSLLKATDFQANRALVADRGLGDRRVVHFATHGLLNSEHPDLSGLVLSLVDEKGAAQDGFLRMHEIYNLRLPADLVVLSACQTALGREIRGEGLMGLTRGFMYAGARRVVASLWQVDDESTAELMKRFYRGMLKDGRRPAEALRTAQLEMSRDKRWSAPFYWAGFVLQGEWR